MKINIAFLGGNKLFNLRRDFLLALKYGLHDLGHDVWLSHQQINADRLNILVGAHFIPKENQLAILQSGARYIVVNTEVIRNGMLNFDPAKTDFQGGFLPLLRGGVAVWDVIMDNLSEYAAHGLEARFLRWGWHPKLEEIDTARSKDIDFYFFGSMSERRTALMNGLIQRGFRGIADGECPYFLRNDRIERARVQLNIAQNAVYTHVNSFRLCYLANNRCATLSEKENDPAGYLELASITRDASIEAYAEGVAALLAGDAWRREGERAYQIFRRHPMREGLERALDGLDG